MRMLAVLALAALVSSLAEGCLISKCDLKRKLEEANLDLSHSVKQTGMTDEVFVAKIVCHAERSTGFNTSVVNQLKPHNEGKVPWRTKRHAGGSAFTTQPPMPAKPDKREEPLWNLYGLFQLSNHLVCTSGMTASLNVCGMECTKLIDDDITDDIECLEAVKSMIENDFKGPRRAALIKMARIIFQRECHSVVPSEYFAEC